MTSCFSVNVLGTLESGMFQSCDNLYCKISLLHGQDWVTISGVEEGITQMAKSCQTTSKFENVTLRECVWNFPIQAVYESTNVFGWPQVVICVYGMDFMGRDIVKGYGCLRLPRSSGRFTKYISMITPLASSPLSNFLSFITGRKPEFIDSKFISKSEGREVTRVQSSGSVKLNLNIIIKDLDNFGYTY
ncbi:B9 domain-containing protein 1 [Lobulomyces angularis]|nr:B9 domain-containing protein 1 [Lobulomyces angularis]